MKKELEKKLFEKYPKLFVQKDLSKNRTCMCWGISTDNGWYWLLDQLCSRIQTYIDANKHLNIPQVEFTQIKEKFATLRIYYVGGSELINGMIWFAEYLSESICETCGDIEGVTINETGWMVALCSKCRKEYSKKLMSNHF